MAKPRRDSSSGNEGIHSLIGELIKPADAEVHYWLPTGSLLLDCAINNGLPGGKLVEIYGREGSGKTAIALSIARQAQSAGGIVCWIDAEARLSVSLAEDIIGVSRDPEKWIYTVPESAEDALHIVETICKRHAQSRTPLVIVLDSVSALCPKPQVEISILEPRVTGKLASLLSWFFSRGVLRYIHGSNVYLVFLNQVRSVLDFYSRFHSGPKYVTPGGYAIAFYSSVRMEVSQVSLEGEGKRRIGAIMRVLVTKNSVGPPFREAVFPFYFDHSSPIRGIDDAMSQVMYLISRGILTEQSRGWYVLDGVKDRRAGWRDRILRDPTTAERFRNLVMDSYCRRSNV